MRFIKKFENFFLTPDVESDEEDYLRNKRNSIMNPEPDSEDTELDSMPMSRQNMTMDEIPEEEYEGEGEFEEGEFEEEEENNFNNNHIMSFEAKNNSYKKSGLKKPEKADLNKDKKISGYEKKRGKAIEDSIDKKGGKGLTAAQKKLPAGLQKAILAKKK
jgi:hypothetical protein